MCIFRTIGILLFLIAIPIFNSFAQEANYYGARNESLARATAGLEDSWALFYNPAGLVFDHTQVLAGYQTKYTSVGINDGAFGFTFPVNNTALGVGVSYFGDHLLNKSKLVAGAAHLIGKTSLGIKTTYDQLKVDELGSKGIFYVDIGGQIRISNEVTLGMVIVNLNQAKFDTLTQSSPTTEVQVGVNYHPHEKLTLLAQVEKDISNPALLRFGLEYLISKNIAVRTGLVPSPASAYAGLGFSWFNMNFDIVGSYQNALGWSGGLSIGIPIINKHED